MSESKYYNEAYKAGHRIGYGDGRHDALKHVARSNSVWFVGGIALGLAMGIAMYLASKGGL